MLNAKELINSSVGELQEQSKDLRKEIFNMTNELSLTKKLEKPHLLREKKKDRARILTVIRQKQIQEGSHE